MSSDSDKTPKVNSNYRQYDFNYIISKLFVENSRLTILCLILLIIFGTVATLLLKTTGFPSPSVPIAVIQTIYPGAASQTVLDEVTIPIENAIKEVEGVKRYNSTSGNSFSNVVVSIDEKFDVENVKNRLGSAINSAKLPTGAEDPKFVSIDVGGPSFIFAIVGKDRETIHNLSDSFKKDLNQLSQTGKVEEFNPLKKEVIIKLDSDKLQAKGLTANDVSANLASFGESLPAVSNVNLNNRNETITTSIKSSSLEDLKNYTINSTSVQAAANPSQPRPSAKLSEISEISVAYNYQNPEVSMYSWRQDGQPKTQEAVILSIKSVENTDLGVFLDEIKNKISSYSNAEYIYSKDLENNYQTDKNYIIESFSQQRDNEEQVSEVVGGIAGSKIGDEWWGYAGYLLGGIQLVFLLMLAFVSWRAALISATAIPLSLVFTSIWTYISGESFNTLVLFSLVLAIGLVVDPALVVLEAIQRKIDTGMRGNEATLAGVKDVGAGIFMAALTNIIAFVPFGIMTGIFGQIFSYIPFTIIPAIIGSYIVPLIFLAWFGGLILKPNKNASDNEEQNLWPVAKGLIKLNTFILHTPVWVRTLIIFFGILLPVFLTGILFSSGAVKFVDFAEPEDGEILILSGTYLTTITDEDKNQTQKSVLDLISTSQYVSSIAQAQNGFSYYIYLTNPEAREPLAREIAENLNNEINEKYGEKAASNDRKFFDFKITPSGVGGPATDYEVSMLVKTDNSELLAKASKEAGVVMNNLCFNKDDRSVSVNKDCSEGDKMIVKVDDGFTLKDNILKDIVFDRDKFLQSGLAFNGQGPSTLLINQAIKNQFEINNGNSVAKINLDGEINDVILENKEQKIKSEDDLQKYLDATFKAVTQGKLGFSDLGSVESSQPKSTIQRIRGRTVGTVQGRLRGDLAADQSISGLASQAVLNYFTEDSGQKAKDLGLTADNFVSNDDGSGADIAKSFQELGVALILAILISYTALVVFYKSFSQPLAIIYTVPLALIGAFPALAIFVNGQFGFLEIIGLIILVGIVENVAIFLIDAANQKVAEEGWDDKKAISYAAGVRFRPVALTSITAVVSLAPLAITSEFYRSIAVVIMFGILASGLVSLITTPILYIFFRWLSINFKALATPNKFAFFLLPIIGILLLITSLVVFPNSIFGYILLALAILSILAPVFYILYMGFTNPAKKLNKELR
jgi:hydrophobic/amphiphilic exporter-1 (mainly G- bacteria), HAE1 family